MCKVVDFAWLVLHFDMCVLVTHLCTNPTLDLRICYIENMDSYLKTGSPPKKISIGFLSSKKSGNN